MRYLLSLLAVACAAAILTHPAEFSGAASAAVISCTEVMIPSLFAFTVLSVYMQQSGIYRTALRWLTLPLSRLMRLDEELCAVVILGNIGGYPVGAKLLTTLVQQNRLSPSHAGRLMCCCYGSGPSFIITIAGIRVFGSAAAGAVIFAACLTASLVTGIAVCRKGERISLAPAKSRYDLGSDCFVSSVMQAAKVMYTVCAMIVGFSAVRTISDLTGLSAAAAELFGTDKVFPALMEISNIRQMSPDTGHAMPLCAALLTIGGACVIMQVRAITSGKVPLTPFLISRLPAAALSAALASLLSAMLPETQLINGHAAEVFAPEIMPQLISVNTGMSVCVLIMCGMLLGMDKQGSKAYFRSKKQL